MHRPRLFFFVIASLFQNSYAQGLIKPAPLPLIATNVHSWKAKRDQYVTKQQLDYSCGAASLATILRYFYGKDVSELDILNALPNITEAYSLADLRNAARKFGFDAFALAGNVQALQSLSVPAIVFLRPRRAKSRIGHFVVLRGINEDSVKVADPSIGNRVYSRAAFAEMWATRNDASAEGKFLVLMAAPTANPRAIKDRQQEENFFGHDFPRAMQKVRGIVDYQSIAISR